MTLYEGRVVDRKNKAYDANRFFYAIRIDYQNGVPQKVRCEEITEERYRDRVKQRKKERPHRR